MLVAAPTGSGKTVVGEYAVHLALAEGRKCFYTTPIKALSNQKYGDLVRRYGTDSVGLLTGDNSINGEAPVVVMTTEVLRNMLYGGSATLAGLGYVVLDEVHYLADVFRGAVWEEVIIHLPESVRVVALSATVSNAEEFGDWLTQVRGGTTVIVDEHRPVPLWQHVLASGRLYDLFVEDDGGQAGDGAVRAAQVNPELLRLARRELWDPGPGWAPPGPVPAAAPAGGDRAAGRGRPAARDHLHLQPGRLRRGGPAVPGRGPAADHAGRSGGHHRDRGTADGRHPRVRPPGARLRRMAHRPAARYRRPPRGPAAHASRKWSRSCSSPGWYGRSSPPRRWRSGSTCQARTVVIERLDKWNGDTHAALTAGEYTQLTGRAGRRGIDVEGHAVVLWHPGMDPAAVAGLAGTRTYPLNSSFRPSYNMAVNLVGQVGLERAAALLESSFAQFQADRAVVGIARQARRSRQVLAEETVSCDRGDFAEYARLRRELSDLEGAAARQRSSVRRAEALRSLQALRRGDIIQVSGGRRAGIAVVLDPGLSAAGGRRPAGEGRGAAAVPGRQRPTGPTRTPPRCRSCSPSAAR